MNRIEKLTICAADLGELNPMPDIKNVNYIHAKYRLSPTVSAEEGKYIGKGMINTMLPYMMQDGYNRDKKERQIDAVILENDCLRATFLPTFGGRLWSLFDKKHNMELLYKNTVIQPCNLGLRNAWISGGIEFNVGIKGHTPLTCSKMYCDFIGKEAVRFFEFERIREVAYSFTAYLPDGSETLYIRTRIENANDNERYMYWWTNIAFPEDENTRVIVPAKSAFHCTYQENGYEVSKENIPIIDETDTSYPVRVVSSNDYFYQIPNEENKWIVAVQKKGRGLLQYSDNMLKGRKLFLWGNGQGGRHWSEFLSEKGQKYIEIQAGLLTSQLEHIPMSANSVWEWTEGYTAIDGCGRYYGDWDEAVSAVQETVKGKIASRAMVSFENLDKLDIEGETVRAFNGSGWGYLENLVRTQSGRRKISEKLNFDSKGDGDISDWLFMLEKGYMPSHDFHNPPETYIKGCFWRNLLNSSSDVDTNWYTNLHLGVILYEEGNLREAERAWKKSAEVQPSLWAYRNLAMLYKNEYNEPITAAEYMDKAYLTDCRCEAFLKEYFAFLSDNGNDKKLLGLYEKLSDKQKDNPRLKVCKAKALIHLGEFERAAEIINKDLVISDIKEGELSLSTLWKDIYSAILMRDKKIDRDAAEKIVFTEYPLPYELDFRMM